MDYFQSVVIDYLRANRSTFVNTEYCVQLNEGGNPDNLGPHWYCDAVAVDFSQETVFLCEITYACQLRALTKRLKSWHDHWDLLVVALGRDSSMAKLGLQWPVRPWLFVPEERIPLLLRKLKWIAGQQQLRFDPKITPLEMVSPWRYCNWNRLGEKEKAI